MESLGQAGGARPRLTGSRQELHKELSNKTSGFKQKKRGVSAEGGLIRPYWKHLEKIVEDGQQRTQVVHAENGGGRDMTSVLRKQNERRSGLGSKCVGAKVVKTCTRDQGTEEKRGKEKNGKSDMAQLTPDANLRRPKNNPRTRTELISEMRRTLKQKPVPKVRNPEGKKDQSWRKKKPMLKVVGISGTQKRGKD